MNKTNKALNSLEQNGNTSYYFLEATKSFKMLRVLRISFPRLATWQLKLRQRKHQHFLWGDWALVQNIVYFQN